MVCTNCGHVGYSKKAVKGSLGVEIVLWLFFLLPGLIYTIWRNSKSARYEACVVCGKATLVPANTPMGQKLMADQGKTLEDIKEEEKKFKANVNKSTLKTLKIIGIIGAVWLVLGLIASIGFK